MIYLIDSFLANSPQMSFFWKTASLLIILVSFYAGVKS